MADDKDRDDVLDASGQRSGRYPGVSLGDALEAAGRLYKAEKLSPVTKETGASKMGYKGLSGPARVMIGALRQYGLIEKTRPGQFRLSKLANEALHGNEAQRVDALRRAALSPQLFTMLAQTHLDASEDNVKSFLMVNKGFIDTGARIAAKAFRDSMQLANVLDSGYSGETDCAEAQDNQPSWMHKLDMGLFKTEAQKSDTAGDKPADGMFALNVPFAKSSISVQVRVAGQPISKAALAKVRKFIELAEEDLEEADE